MRGGQFRHQLRPLTMLDPPALIIEQTRNAFARGFLPDRAGLGICPLLASGIAWARHSRFQKTEKGLPNWNWPGAVATLLFALKPASRSASRPCWRLNGLKAAVPSAPTIAHFTVEIGSECIRRGTIGRNAS